MSRARTLQDLFKRYRRPGDLVFAILFLIFFGLAVKPIGKSNAMDAANKIVCPALVLANSFPGFDDFVCLAALDRLNLFTAYSWTLG